MPIQFFGRKYQGHAPARGFRKPSILQQLGDVMRHTLLIAGFLAATSGAIPAEAALVSPSVGVETSSLTDLMPQDRDLNGYSSGIGSLSGAADESASNYAIGNFSFGEDKDDVTGDGDPAGAYSAMRQPDFCDPGDSADHDPQLLTTMSVANVPEPSTMALFALGLFGFAALGRGRRLTSR